MKISKIILILSYLFHYSFSYNWPLNPSNEQHRITGTFGECRGEQSRSHVHAGIDMDIVSGSDDPVYPVETGTIIDITIQYANDTEKKEWW